MINTIFFFIKYSRSLFPARFQPKRNQRRKILTEKSCLYIKKPHLLTFPIPILGLGNNELRLKWFLRFINETKQTCQTIADLLCHFPQMQ